LANAATEAFEHARETARAFLNAGSVDEVIFTVTRAEGLEPDAVTEALMQGLARVSTNANSIELRVRVASG
ncbi:MAG: hypothetical protein IAE78_15765, partial [Myxococcus sp.]|nr:hypothetical protein [Myxococcus sp.]